LDPPGTGHPIRFRRGKMKLYSRVVGAANNVSAGGA
jgi:hypothetical protein